MTEPKVKPVPEGMHTETPHLICADAAYASRKNLKAIQADSKAPPDVQCSRVKEEGKETRLTCQGMDSLIRYSIYPP
jgi:hypothetical protein